MVKKLPASITEETEPDWVGVKVRAIVTLSSPAEVAGEEDIKHEFYTGWASILPSGGLSF